MTNSDDGITLLAMTPAGEAVIVEERNRTTLIELTTRGDHRVDATRQDAETAVRRHGWLAIYQRFDSWAELERFRVRIAEQTLQEFPDIDVESYDRRAVEVTLRQVERAGPERRMLAEKLLIDLLVRCRLVSQDEALRSRIGDRLAALKHATVITGLGSMPATSNYPDLARLDPDYGLDAA